MSLQRSAAEAKVVLYGDPSEEAAASYQMLGSIRLKQGRTEQALKWLTKVINPKKAFYFSPTFFLTSYFLKVTFNISPPQPIGQIPDPCYPAQYSIQDEAIFHQQSKILHPLQLHITKYMNEISTSCSAFSFGCSWTALVLHSLFL